MFFRALPLLLLFLACRDGLTRRTDPPPPMPMCNDGKIDDGEECDGSALADQTCRSLGFEAGQLTCGMDCRFVKTLCTKRCGNGVLDPGETCDGTLGVPVCTSYGSNRCGDDCKIDAANCLSQAFEPAPELTVTNGGPAVIADVPPSGVPDLVMAVPSRNRVELFSWNTVQGFSGATSRKLSFQRTPIACVAGDLTGDGALDVAAVNDTGAFDAYVATGSTFGLRELDGGCAGAQLVGVVRAPQGELAVAFGCGAVFTLEAAGVRRVPVPDAGAVGVGDFTRDGLGDLLVVDGAGDQLTVLPGPGFERDAGLLLGALPSRLAPGDLDGDGDADLAAIVGNDVKLYENTGTALAEKLTFAAPRALAVEVRDFDLDGVVDVFFTAGDDVVVRRNRGQWAFAEFRQAVGAGARLSVAVGDVDADQDPDVAVTFSTGADATRTAVVRNRAR
ncbi:MAG: VCBS repeat-containing protein [Myxococcaceae bacterium]|nr:VCBS repeat-containing protein [Myxococcaceae bacterium]